MKKYLFLLLVLFLYSHANAYVVEGTYTLLSIDDTTLDDKYIIAFYNTNDTIQVLSKRDTLNKKHKHGKRLRVSKEYYLTIAPTQLYDDLSFPSLGLSIITGENRGRKVLDFGETFYKADEIDGIRYKHKIEDNARKCCTRKGILHFTSSYATLKIFDKKILRNIAKYVDNNNADTFYIDFYYTCRNDSVVCEKISNIEDYLMGVMKKTNVQILHFYLTEAVYKNKNAKNLSYVGYGIRTSTDDEYQFGNKYLHADRFNHKYDTYAIPVNCNVK